MATYYVYSGAGGTNAGTSWTNAYTAFSSAVTAATADGDIILVHYGHQEELSADTTYTFPTGNQVFVCSVDKDNSDVVMPMSTNGWIGNSTTNRSITCGGTTSRVFIYGITFRTAGSTSDSISMSSSSAGIFRLEDCYLWHGNSSSSSNINLASHEAAMVTLHGCTFRFGNASQRITVTGNVYIDGGSITNAGSTPTGLFGASGNSITCFMTGFDVSLITGTLIPAQSYHNLFVFDRCKLGAGVTVLASQTTQNGQALVLDCASGDTHGLFAYYNKFGSLTSDTGIYFTSGDAGQSWKIATTSYCGPSTPFISPWVDLYWSGTSAITPYVEALRDGSATAYTDAEIWIEVAAKKTSGTTLATFSNDRVAGYEKGGTGSAQADGAGLGSWTGEAGTAKSLKLALGSSITPAEAGPMTARFISGTPSLTFYVDPQIRT